MKRQNKAAKLAQPKKAMSQPAKVTIRKLPTGVRGLDDIMGGGIPEFSFNIIAGTPGCGKTTLAHQIVFANATPKKPALYFTVLGEPALKMLRYQQQYSFFDESKLGQAIRFINLARRAAGEGFERGAGGNYPASHGGQPEASWWWIPFAPWCAKRLAARAKWRCNRSSSVSPSF